MTIITNAKLIQNGLKNTYPREETIKMTTNPTPKKRWLNVHELSVEFGFSKSTQYLLRKNKQIPFTQIKATSKTNKNNGSVLYDRVDIDKWLEDNKVN